MNDKQKVIHEKMRRKIANLSLQTVLEMFEMTEAMEGEPETSLLREFLMNEMEKRDPAAFATWIESNDPKLIVKPSHFFKDAK